MGKMIQETSTILWNQRINDGYGRIGLTCNPIYQGSKPGQFVTLRFADQVSPLLRRPFSIHRLIDRKTESGIEILYKIVGKFTQDLSHAKTGDSIDLIGPLGHGFTLSGQYKKIALVAGGIGIAPLVYLCESLAETMGNLDQSAVFIGGKTKTDILCKPVFESLKLNITVTTEDGSDGKTGLVIEPLARWLKANRPDMIYACGSMPMLKAVIALAKLENVSCEVSVETMMACGIGACLGCAIQTNVDKDKYRHVCVDGPVFNAEHLYND